MKLSPILLTIFSFISTLVFARINTTRVACVGNSITYGAGITDPAKDSYPSQLGMILDDGYEVKNFGVSGRTMLKKGDRPFWNEPQFRQTLEYKPNIVVILLGTNDTKPFNWIYKNEFIPDYISMIDTFCQIETKPVIYACYPPPSFDTTWGIRDSIVTTDMIPMIDKIIDSVGVSLIDLHSPLVDKEFLFPDYIHPSVEGSWEMAQIVADSIAGVNIETMNDVNVAKGQSVTVSGFDELGPPQNLNDGDRLTKWTVEGFGNWAVVDIGDLEEIDMFQVDFNEKSSKGFQYIIEVSPDSISWTTVVDQSARDDTVSQISVDKIDPTIARYVKITINDASNSKDEKISISEFRILKNAFFHASILSMRLKSVSESIIIYYLDIIPTSNEGELIKLYKNLNDEYFSTSKGFREAVIQQITTVIRPEQVHQYYTATYKDAKIMISDTLTLNFEILSSITPNVGWQQPILFKLMHNYPNPFNPQTTIEYQLPEKTHVSLKVFDIQGHEITTLVNGEQAQGHYSVKFDGHNLSSGVYIYQLETNEQILNKRMLLLK